ncbi:gag/pol protein [Cucumis melo var. makuwa]|uniref:Gag/pol protein n=1 Tax=Cucumis melo var. makuwa TaxID=1194695 RepID=A0A5D3DD29_CUCMM|nr:gag/pol protein [Cucumis melo var. makuwa]TYK21482.1 gag/pol protein [Cucumis melo var. makuwa]
MNKISYTLTTLLNELQTFESLMKIKGQKGEANVATSTRKFHRGSTFGTKSVSSSSGNKKWEKEKGGQGNKANPATAKTSKKAKVAKGICFHCNQEGYWKRNCPKYLVEKKKIKQGKYDLLVLKTCLVENDDSAWIIDSGATNHVCSSFQGISSWWQLEIGEITMQVGTGHVVSAIADPLTFKKAMEDVDKDEWIKAMNLELEFMYFNSVWDLVDQLDGVKPIGCKWIYKRKRGANGLLTDIKQWLAAQFQMKDLGEAQFVLGIQIFGDCKNKMLALSQASYIDKIVVKYSMQNSKRGLLPFRHGVTLSKKQCPKTPQEVEVMRHIPYASAIGSLMYAILCTRPHICYAVGIVNKYQSNPELAHWIVVKTILKYLRRTRDYILLYGSKDLILTGYTDSNFQTHRDSRKSISGSVFTLNGGAVVWRSIKQGCIADSTMEAEYVATCEAAKEAVWLRKFLNDLQVVLNMSKPITLYCDNSEAVANSKEPRSHKAWKTY